MRLREGSPTHPGGQALSNTPTLFRYYVAVKTRLDDPVHDHQILHWVTYWDGWQLSNTFDIAHAFESEVDALDVKEEMMREHRPVVAMLFFLADVTCAP
jgi:hypothetical protein